MTHHFYIGIDPGVQTGFAVVSSQDATKFIQIATLQIHEAMQLVLNYCNNYGKENVTVKFEDARLRKWYGNTSTERYQGAGSIKRDSKIWEDFLLDHKIHFIPVQPANNRTKITAATFNEITGYNKTTTNHSRDAAMLVYGQRPSKFKIIQSKINRR